MARLAGWQLMLNFGQEHSWGCHLEYLHGTAPHGLGFSQNEGWVMRGSSPGTMPSKRQEQNCWARKGNWVKLPRCYFCHVLLVREVNKAFLDSRKWRNRFHFFLLFVFLKLVILYWRIADEQCWDSFRWTAKGLSHIYTCNHSPPSSPSIQAAP